MRHPGYLLNPGDLFQVNPERVMFATGAPKDKYDRRQGRIAKRQASGATKKAEDEGAEETTSSEEQKAEEPVEKAEDPRETLKTLLSQAKSIMSSSKDVLPAKRKQEIRGFQKAVRRVLSRSQSSTVLTDNLEAQFSELTALLRASRIQSDSQSKEKKSTPRNIDSAETAAAREQTESESQPGEKLTEAFRLAAQNPEAALDTDVAEELSERELDVLKRALAQLRDNPIDNTKPYATPWRPRDYMSAFAFIPRYLEVNQNICAAVYLRHPVARPGFAEVPTPFGESIATPAFTWYLRRR